MLRKFKVSNFKGFEKDFELDLTDVNGYEFNKNSIFFSSNSAFMASVSVFSQKAYRFLPLYFSNPV